MYVPTSREDMEMLDLERETMSEKFVESEKVTAYDLFEKEKNETINNGLHILYDTTVHAVEIITTELKHLISPLQFWTTIGIPAMSCVLKSFT